MNGVVEVDGVKGEDSMDQTDDKAKEGILVYFLVLI